jgi:hypothetical protein
MARFIMSQATAIARCISGLILCGLFSAPALHAAESSTSEVNAFYLHSVPERYLDLEKLFPLLKSGGANTIIVRPRRNNGNIDAAALTNLTFLAHQAGMKIYAVLPTRLDNSVLKKNSDWEDVRYDFGSGGLKDTGRLDLSNPQVVAHLVKRFTEVAAFSVDGILLDEDFRYEIGDGLSSYILKEYARKYGSTFAPKKVFAKVSSATTEIDSGTFDASFWQWSDLKKNAIVNAAQELSKACRAVQGTVKFGLPLHVPGGETPPQALARFAYDMNAFRTLDIDFYWFEFRAFDGEIKGGGSYKKNFEYYSRMVKSASTMLKDPAKMIIVIPSTSSGKVLPIFEIEDTTALARQAGKPGIAYLMEQTAVPPAALTTKLFKRE